MALHLVSSEHLRTHTRQRLESLELWLRRLIHDEFVASYGADYVNTASINGEAIFNTNTQKYVALRIATSCAAIARPVDTLSLDHLSTIIYKEAVYHTHFSRALSHGFPHGQHCLRLILQRLVPIRTLYTTPTQSVRTMRRGPCAIAATSSIA